MPWKKIISRFVSVLLLFVVLCFLVGILSRLLRSPIQQILTTTGQELQQIPVISQIRQKYKIVSKYGLKNLWYTTGYEECCEEWKRTLAEKPLYKRSIYKRSITISISPKDVSVDFDLWIKSTHPLAEIITRGFSKENALIPFIEAAFGEIEFSKPGMFTWKPVMLTLDEYSSPIWTLDRKTQLLHFHVSSSQTTDIRSLKGSRVKASSESLGDTFVLRLKEMRLVDISPVPVEATSSSVPEKAAETDDAPTTDDATKTTNDAPTTDDVTKIDEINIYQISIENAATDVSFTVRSPKSSGGNNRALPPERKSYQGFLKQMGTLIGDIPLVSRLLYDLLKILPLLIFWIWILKFSKQNPPFAMQLLTVVEGLFLFHFAVSIVSGMTPLLWDLSAFYTLLRDKFSLSFLPHVDISPYTVGSILLGVLLPAILYQWMRKPERNSKQTEEKNTASNNSAKQDPKRSKDTLKLSITRFLKRLKGTASFRLTEYSFTKLKEENIPEYILKALEPLKNRVILGEDEFLDVIKKHIREVQTVRYKTFILKHAKYTLKESITRFLKRLKESITRFLRSNIIRRTSRVVVFLLLLLLMLTLATFVKRVKEEFEFYSSVVLVTFFILMLLGIMYLILSGKLFRFEGILPSKWGILRKLFWLLPLILMMALFPSLIVPIFLMGVALRVLYYMVTDTGPRFEIVLSVTVLILFVLLVRPVPKCTLQQILYELVWFLISIELGYALLESLRSMITPLIKQMFPNWQLSKENRRGLVVLAVVSVIPMQKLLDSASPWAIDRMVIFLAFHFDKWVLYVWLFGVLWLLHAEGKAKQEINGFTRIIGILGMSSVLFRLTDHWSYIPVNFLIGWFLLSRFVRPIEYWNKMKPCFKRVFEEREEMLDQILDLRAAERAYKGLRKELSNQLTSQKKTFQEYESELEKSREQLSNLQKKAKINGQSAKEVVFAFGPYGSAWQNGVHGAKWSLLFALPWIFFSFYRFFTNPVTVIYYPLWILGNEILTILLKWVGQGFLFGYFYPYLRGKNGLQKSVWLFLVLLLPTLPLLSLSNVTIEDWRATLLWASLIFLQCILLGLVAFDYTVLRKGRYEWQTLFEVHGIASVGLSVSSILIAVGGAVTALMTSQVTKLVLLALNFIIPEGASDIADLMKQQGL